MLQSLILFEEAYFERLWGGDRLRTTLDRPAPENKSIGEAWLISDHASHESIVANGIWAGQTLHDLLQEQRAYLLGSLAQPTIHGRFPLLLKVLDAADVLSVQVHPDDEAARALDEPDIGKTEMWHVLESEPGSELICGLEQAVDRDAFLRAVEDGSLATEMRRFPASPGTSVFVAAGTVHAIGAGVLLAEIQQNSDLTYRIYDWDRVDAKGQRRELHLEKAARVIHFGSGHGGAAKPLSYTGDGGEVTVLGACRYFASELIAVDGTRTRSTGGRSFHIVLPRDGTMTLRAGHDEVELRRCQAALVPGGAGDYMLTGSGSVLVYYVPDLLNDIAAPLRAAGHGVDDVVQLEGAKDRGELAAMLGR